MQRKDQNKGQFNILWVFVACFFVLFLLGKAKDTSHDNQKFTYQDFKQVVDENRLVKEEGLIIKDDRIIEGKYKALNSGLVKSFVMDFKLINDPSFIQELKEKKIPFKFIYVTNWSSVVGSLLPLLLLFVFGIMIFRGMKNAAGGGVLGAGKKHSFERTVAENITVSLEDVAGIDESKAEAREIIDFLKDPEKFTRIGAKIPKGVLLVGSPGTGKTMLARAIAKEANVPFLYGSASSFIEMFVGVGASRVRELFDQAKKEGRCIIFIDEIDAVGGKRSSGGFGGGNSEKDQTINQLLTEMDGFDSNPGVIVIAATNRVDMLDDALVRPGRFDRKIKVEMPDVVGREEIFRVHSSGKRVHQDVDLHRLAKGTPGFSGASIANVCNEAAILAAREASKFVTMKHFEEAIDKELMGPERRTMKLTEEQKWTTAVHEAGHTIINKAFKSLDPLHKVSIVPRGMALGVTQTLPEGNQLNYTKTKCLDMISMLLGGRLAELQEFGELSTGAGNDIEKVTEIARQMVYSWGMSELGPINLMENPQMDFKNKFSEDIRKKADQIVQNIIMEQEERTKEILQKNKEKLLALSKELMEKEVLNAIEVNEIVKEVKI